MHRYLKLNNIYLLFLTIRKVNNWLTYILDFFNLLKTGSVIYDMRDGLKYFARTKTSDRGIINTVVIQDEYELGKLDLHDATIIDLGGQNGYFSVFASKIATNIYTFEPIPKNYCNIQKNITLNNLGEVIHPFNKAVADKPGLIKIFLAENTGGHSIHGTGKEFVEVEAATLPEIFEKNNITKCDLLKIDIEGSEYGILYNLSDEYFEKIANIRMEAHEIDSNKQNHEFLIDFLKSKGYLTTYKFPILFAEKK